MKLFAKKVVIASVEEVKNLLSLDYDKATLDGNVELFKKHGLNHYDFVCEYMHDYEVAEVLREGGFDYTDYRIIEVAENTYMYYNLRTLCLNYTNVIKFNGKTYEFHESDYDDNLYNERMNMYDDIEKSLES